MSSYSEILAAIEKTVASTAWSTQFPTIKTYPLDWAGTITDTPVFFKLALVLPQSQTISYDSDRKLNGEIVIQILGIASYGTRNFYKRADELQTILGERGFELSSGTLTTKLGYINRIGASGDSSLLRYDFHLPFDYYGG